MSFPPRYIIKVFLYGIEPAIWRRFSIPATATFRDLHDAVQQAMGWEDKHWHEFRHGKGKRLLDVIGPDHPEVEKGENFQEESKITLKDFVGRRPFPIRFLYRYDFKDEWVHEIAIEKKTEDGEGGLPILLEGERACPPEDAGGPFGYLAAFNGDLMWLDDDYDPEHFDPKEVTFGKKRRRRK
jgi:hypothetical protein